MLNAQKLHILGPADAPCLYFLRLLIKRIYTYMYLQTDPFHNYSSIFNRDLPD